MATRGFKPKRVRYIPRPDDKGAVVDFWDMPDASNIINDYSGNGNHGTVSGLVGIERGVEDVKYVGHGGGSALITVASDATIDNQDAQTIQCAVLKKSAGEGSAGRICAKTTRLRFYTDATRLNLLQKFSGVDGLWRCDHPSNIPTFLQVTYDKSAVGNDPVIYINGTSATITESSTPTGTYISDAGLDFQLMNTSGLNRTLDGYVSNFRLFPSILSAADLRDEYLKFALGHVVRPTPRFEHPVTASAVASPNQVGPWNTWAGSHEWLDDGSERYLKHDNTARRYYASLQSKQAYGAWYFKYSVGAGGSFTGVPWAICNLPDVIFVDAGYNGYILQHGTDESLIIYRLSGGAITQVATSGVSWVPSGAQEIECFITHRIADGRFTLYTREATHTTWTQACQGTDNTHTTTDYIQNYSNAIGYDLSFYGITMWPYGDTLTPNDVEEISD